MLLYSAQDFWVLPANPPLFQKQMLSIHMRSHPSALKGYAENDLCIYELCVQKFYFCDVSDVSFQTSFISSFAILISSLFLNYTDI
jgi:hypothetical protein